ncbi:MAG TPA: biotin/lipoyl-containing protein [Polyangiaceae bacterium]|nr:biotin/lipoyl-containing protein [Polyangiaceae bacterium]
MRYLVGIGASDHSVEVNRGARGLTVRDALGERLAGIEGELNCYRVRLDDRLLALTLRTVGKPDAEGRTPVEVHHQGRAFTFRIASARDARSGVTRSGKGAATRTVLAQMPGKILQVRATAGSHAQAGEALLVIEAMKMENEVCAETDCDIVEVRVRAGETVDAGAVLLIVR